MKILTGIIMQSVSYIDWVDVNNGLTDPTHKLKRYDVSGGLCLCLCLCKSLCIHLLVMWSLVVTPLIPEQFIKTSVNDVIKTKIQLLSKQQFLYPWFNTNSRCIAYQINTLWLITDSSSNTAWVIKVNSSFNTHTYSVSTNSPHPQCVSNVWMTSLPWDYINSGQAV